MSSAISGQLERGRITPFPMQISLSKNSDVPLRQQLAEQIVFLITTGQLRAGQQLPSVRSLARRVKVHHNTVSEAYQDLVRRNWVTRQRGSRLIVGVRKGSSQPLPSSLDELINESIQRAKQMGYSLQALTECVRNRLLAEPADHFLVVEEEPGLRELISHEIQEKLGWSVESCSPEQFTQEPGLAVGAQVFAPNHIIEELRSLVPPSRPSISIIYSGADQHLDLIRGLKKPSIVAAVSVSGSLLKTARSLFAPAIARRHTFREFLIPQGERIELSGIDVAFCDSLTMPAVSCRRRIQYRLVAASCFEDLAIAVEPARDVVPDKSE
jgi:DNA-binding transcriptional regulator YhcF (GntR family)